MGDRANVAIVHRSWDREEKCSKIDGILYAYFHWAGEEVRDLTIKAVKAAEGRWDDPHYANRIALRSLFDDYKDETGAGFGLEPGDQEHGRSWYLIDWEKQQVFFLPYSALYQPLAEKIAAYTDFPATSFKQINKLPRLEP